MRKKVQTSTAELMEITFTSLPEKQTELSFSKCFFSAIPRKSSFFPGGAGYSWDSRENSVVWPVCDSKRRTERLLVPIAVMKSFFLVDQIEFFMFTVDWHSFHLCWWVLSCSYKKVWHIWTAGLQENFYPAYRITGLYSATKKKNQNNI